MITLVREWVISIVILTLFLLIIDILLPSGRIRRVVNLAAGVLVVITIIKPIASMAVPNFSFEGMFVTDSNNLMEQDIENMVGYINEDNLSNTVNVYREKILGTINRQLDAMKGFSVISTDIIINEDINGDDFGEIYRVFIEISLDNSESNDGEDINVDIDMVKVESIDSSNKMHLVKDNKLVEEIKMEISVLLKIPMESIIVMIGGM